MNDIPGDPPFPVTIDIEDMSGWKSLEVEPITTLEVVITANGFVELTDPEWITCSEPSNIFCDNRSVKLRDSMTYQLE